MKFLFVILLSLPLSVMTDVCSTDKNIKDYFLSIPHSELKIADDKKGYLESVEDREKAIEILDVRNGFIELQNKTILSKTQVVLYRAKDKRPVIIVTSDGASVQSVKAFICVEKKWINVTEVLFPKISYQEIAEHYRTNGIKVLGRFMFAEDLSMVAHTLVRYKLPRLGKEIQAYASHPDLTVSEQKTLFSFVPQFDKLSWK